MTFTDITVGTNFACALDIKRRAWCWGYAGVGANGLDSYLPELVDSASAGVPGFVAISAGLRHVCAIDGIGRVWCWGSDSVGQLGDNSDFQGKDIPVKVGFPDNYRFRDISAGGLATCATSTLNKVYCWGDNSKLQAGRVTDAEAQPTPLLVATPPGVEFSQAKVGLSHACALDLDGQAWCWGDTAIQVPTKLDQTAIGAQGFERITMGDDVSCGLDSQYRPWCWGGDVEGALGNGLERADTSKPVPVSLPVDLRIVEISADSAVCALDSTGAVHCWGNGRWGQLGNGVPAQAASPSIVIDGQATSVTVGEKHSCALVGDGDLHCWGSNAWGQLGNESAMDAAEPMLVTIPGMPGKKFVAIDASRNHTCALDAESAAWCWGAYYDGDEAIGRPNADDVAIPGPVEEAPSIGFKSISTGTYATCAVDVAGALWCWGWDYKGALGNGPGEVNSATPVQLSTPGLKFESVALGDSFGCAIASVSRNLHCWGRNYYGQLGLGDEDDRDVPTLVPAGYTDWFELDAGLNHICGTRPVAGKPDARALWCWGSNVVGESMQDNSVVRQLVPVQVAEIELLAGPNAHSVFALGQYASCARSSLFGQSYCFGLNVHGLFGNGSPPGDAGTYPAFTGLDVVRMSVGVQHACVITASGSVACAGDRSDGQVGDGYMSNARLPREIDNFSAWARDIHSNGFEE